MATRILLGGGGSAADERPLLEQFASWLNPQEPLLYLPLAMPGAGPAQFSWINTALEPFGIKHITMWTALDRHQPQELEAYAAIFIGGGNTYHLLDQLRSARFLPALRAYAQAGGILYGGSAGAILLGRDIDTCAHMDQNIPGIKDTAGLDLVHGRAIWCHYTPAADPMVAEYMARKRIPVIALAETAGLWVRGPGDIISLGTEAVYFR